MGEERLEVLLSTEEIAAGVKRLGEAIARDYDGQNPLFVGVLKGAVVFLADLIRAVPIPVRYDFIAVSSYGAATRSSGQVKILKDLDYSLEDEAVILVEDIVDTGLTLNYLLASFRARRPRSLRVCTLLDKPSRRLVELKPDYNAFVIPDHFVVGYGLDYAEKYRNLPYIAVLKKACDG
ncbi:MAG: hypoxanthine phosphoribosyltransferase [Firmicutes bacterium]|nr:hypoxanthine phosphoribosyltransferase [Bacillota bacterium]